MQTDWSVVLTFLPQLVEGARITIYITAVGLLGGVAIGLLAGLMRAYGGPILNAIAFAYIELIRGTPIVVQVMFLYFAMPVLAGLRIDPMSAAILAIIVNAGAYIAEIVRGAFLSISKGLTEAGLAIEGMTMLVVTHEMSFAKQVGTRLIFMEHGKIAVDGRPRDVIETPPNDRLKDFLQHVG